MLEILDTVVLQEFVSHPVMERLNEPVMPGLAWWDAVSYTHLTLPTIYSV